MRLSTAFPPIASFFLQNTKFYTFCDRAPSSFISHTIMYILTGYQMCGQFGRRNFWEMVAPATNVFSPVQRSAICPGLFNQALYRLQSGVLCVRNLCISHALRATTGVSGQKMHFIACFAHFLTNSIDCHFFMSTTFGRILRLKFLDRNLIKM